MVKMEYKIDIILILKPLSSNLWCKCDKCGTMIFHRELTQSLFVCNSCNHHMYISPRNRFKSLFDGGLFNEIVYDNPKSDPLNFKDTKKYNDRLTVKIRSLESRTPVLKNRSAKVANRD